MEAPPKDGSTFLAQVECGLPLNLSTTKEELPYHNKVTIEVGMLAIIKDDNTSPMNWMLGGVILVHPGADQIVRVGSIQTKFGIYKRPVNKICILPMSETDD